MPKSKHRKKKPGSDTKPQVSWIGMGNKAALVHKSGFRLSAGAGIEGSPAAEMPYKHNEPRRHKIPKAKYKVSNWREYDQALRQRGSLTVWVTPEALEAWAPARTGQRGRPTSYSDIVIETAVMLRRASPGGRLRGCCARSSRCGGEELAVRAERHRPDRVIMGDAGALAAVRHRHQPRLALCLTDIPARGGEELAIRAERHRGDRAIVGDAG
jgi:hypothetical protein